MSVTTAAPAPDEPTNNNKDMSQFQFMEMVYNVMSTRSELINKFLDPRRDILLECGHPTTGEITPQHYQFLYERESTATRVVEVLPKECWAEHPELYEDEDPEVETTFELAFKDMGKRLSGNSKYKSTENSHPIWEPLKRADILSGIGQFGVILLGFDDVTVGENGESDGTSLKDPVEGVEEYYRKPPEPDKKKEKKPKKKPPTNGKPFPPKKEEEVDTEIDTEKEEPVVPETPAFKPKRNLIYLRVFEQHLIQVTQYEDNKSSPRYGQPKEYLLTFNDPSNQMNSGVGLLTNQQHVHWTRVIHVADNIGSSEIFGVPRMRPVYNKLMDLMKLYGGSAEMYWRGAFPGFSLETHPQLGGDVTVDTPAIRAQMTNYMNKLQRYISLMGMSAKSLAPQVVDPTAQINVQIEAICIQIGIPKRIFMGSERGELASSEDEGQWTERVEERQKGYVIPRIIVPFIDRMIAAKVLPEPEDGFCCEWPTLETESELDKATVAKTKTEALSAYVAGGVDALISPMDYLTIVLGLTDEEADSVLKNAVEHINEANPDLDDVTVPGAHPEPPPPEIPESPVKMKDGETLVAPDGTPLPGKKKPPFVKNQKSEVLDDEEDFFEDSQDELEPTATANRGNVLTLQSNDVLDNPVVSDVVNYNPSQPRDSRGRFGSGGGSGGGGATSTQQGPPESFKKFATDAEKKELNKLAKERNDLNKKVKDGTASEAERVKAVMVKRRIAELKEIADARSKGVEPPVKPVIEVKPVPKIEIEKPVVPVITPPDSKIGSIRDKVNNNKELEDLRQSVVNTSFRSDETKKLVDLKEQEQKQHWDALMEHDKSNRSGLTEEEDRIHSDKRTELSKIHAKAQSDKYEVEARHREALEGDNAEIHKVLALDKTERTKIYGNSTLGSKESSLKLKVIQGRSFVENMVSKKVVPQIEVGVTKNRNRSGRSQYECKKSSFDGRIIPGSAKIAMTKDAAISSVVHEYTHAVEHASHDLYLKCVDFRESRIRESSSHQINFRQKYGRGYKAGENGNKDQFDKFFVDESKAEYVGKNYGFGSGATEILTMGMEAIYTDPRKFAEKDPEYFKFVVGAVRGVI